MKTNDNTMTAPELEAAVLGALMIEREAFETVQGLLTEATFANQANAHIFMACSELAAEGSPIDILTVTERLREKRKLKAVGGAAYISKLTLKVASSANLEYHARMLQQKYMRRKAARIAEEAARKAVDPSEDVFGLIDDAAAKLSELATVAFSGECRGVQGLIPEYANWVQEAREREEEVLGLATGIDELDRMTTGLRESDLVILAARPGMGKTAFALHVVRQACKAWKNVAFFSMEMSSQQLISRLTGLEGGIPAAELRDPKLMDTATYRQKFLPAIERISSWGLYIDDKPAATIEEIRAKARRTERLAGGLDLVVIDYLQLAKAQGRHGTREQEVSIISQGAKAIAKELNVPVLALSQLSRAVEIRGGAKRPQLSDLRESGSIEQDADIVAFLYRAEYYKIFEDEDGNSTKGLCEVIIGKNRHGPQGTIECTFNSKFVSFTNLSEEERMEASLFEEQQTPF